MMTAEKAADLILGHTPLPAEPVPFYRHGQAAARRGRTPLAPMRDARARGRRAGSRRRPFLATPPRTRER